MKNKELHIHLFLHEEWKNITYWNDNKRFNLIEKEIDPNNISVLDIGAHWGFMSHELELIEKQCVAVKNNPRCCEIMRAFRAYTHFKFTIVEDDIFDFCKPPKQCDTVLVLAVFHNFLKSAEKYHALIDLLGRMQMKEMFLWCHDLNELLNFK